MRRLLKIFNDDENVTDALPRKPRKPDENPDIEEIPKKNKDNNNKGKHPKIPNNQTLQVTNINISQSTGIHIGNTNNLYSGNTTREQINIKENSQIVVLKQNTKAVSRPDVAFLSEHITDKWPLCARHLKYSSGQIDGFIHKNPNNLQETVYQFLTDWIQNNGPLEATVAILANALWITQQQEAVHLWAEQYEKINGNN